MMSNPQVEHLPATEAPRQDLVLLHGWGGDREFWRPLVKFLRPWANLTLVDVRVPEELAEQDAADALSATIADILVCSPERAIYLGFSLGGKIALELADRVPERVSAVVSICANPCFVAADGWPGMGREEFVQFRHALESSPTSALRRFDALQVRGAGNERALLRELRRHRRAPAEGLGPGLDWLEQLDQREMLLRLDVPQCHLFAAADALVPQGVAGAVSSALDARPRCRVERIAAGCHLLPWEEPQLLVSALSEFLRTEGLFRAVAGEPAQVNKADVAASFSRAAPRYDSVAVLQQDVGRRLLASLDSVAAEPEVVLDLGCGTGFFAAQLRARFPAARYIGLDLAEGMVDFARERCDGAGEWLVGDAEELPLAAGSVDLVFSSLAFQWCYRPEQLFSELARVLSPRGMCVFTSLGPATLHELRESWAAVDAHQHVNTFLERDDLAHAAQDTAEISLALETQSLTLQYQRVRDLLDELKTLGAHNMNRSRQQGLTSRRTLQGMLQAYEAWRQNGLLPATYEVYFGKLERA